MVVSQTRFSSVASYNAAYETVKAIAKGIASTPEELLDSLKDISSKGVTVEHLLAAAGDVGKESMVLRNVLNVAVEVLMANLDEPELLKMLQQALARLEKIPKSTNPIRSSAPVGTYPLDSLEGLKKQAQALILQPASNTTIERKRSHELSDVETPPASPQSETPREVKSEKSTRTEKSRREKTRRHATEREASGTKARKEERKTDESQRQLSRQTSGATDGDTSSNASAGSAPVTPRSKPAPVPRPTGPQTPRSQSAAIAALAVQAQQAQSLQKQGEGQQQNEQS